MKEVLKYTGLGLLFWWVVPLVCMVLPIWLVYKIATNPADYPRHEPPSLSYQVQSWFRESSADKQWRRENL